LRSMHAWMHACRSCIHATELSWRLWPLHCRSQVCVVEHCARAVRRDSWCEVAAGAASTQR
jgi:hypothetical protein